MLHLVEIDRQAASGADGHWTVVDQRGQPLSACSAWWTQTPEHPGRRLGVIGHYSASSVEAGGVLLEGVCRVLAERGCTLAVGPMDGNTWRAYRFVTERGPEPPFFLEPDHPHEWPSHFAGHGFQTIATYASALNTRLLREDEAVTRTGGRLRDAGVTLRGLDTSRVNDELRAAYAISLAAFRHAMLFSPLPEETFLALYQPLMPRIVPELVLIAERAGVPVGFVLAVPDWLQAERGEPVTTIVIKTIAVVPDRALGGLGRLLAWECERRAAALGFTRSIHALMPLRSKSANISGSHAAIFRRYALLARALG